MIHNTQSAQISQKQDGRNIYAIIKTMCPPGYHHNDFVATHALGHLDNIAGAIDEDKYCRKSVGDGETEIFE